MGNSYSAAGLEPYRTRVPRFSVALSGDALLDARRVIACTLYKVGCTTKRKDTKFIHRDAVRLALRILFLLRAKIAKVLVDEQQEHFEYQYNDGVPYWRGER